MTVFNVLLNRYKLFWLTVHCFGVRQSEGEPGHAMGTARGRQRKRLKLKATHSHHLFISVLLENNATMHFLITLNIL